jgi:hypothetical protein
LVSNRTPTSLRFDACRSAGIDQNIPKRKTGAIIADSTLYNPKKPNENFLNIDAIKR